MSLRVLCVSNMFPSPAAPDYGGFVERMCGALERLGIDVDLAVIDTRERGVLRTPAKYAALAARAVARARRADVIYAHYLFPTGAIAAACARTAGRRMVVTAHGGDVRNLANPRIRSATQLALGQASSVIAVSRYLAQELRATGLRLPPVHVANMGVDLTRFAVADRGDARARLRLAPTGPLVLAVGGLTPRKNPLVLVQAAERVRRVHPDLRLVLVGDGPLRAAVAAGARRLGLERAVIMTGALPHPAVADWMAACDVLAVPSTVEPLGVVALEALASGRPVVVTREGGAREVVPVPGTGRDVDPHDPRDVARGILEVLATPPDAALCRRAAQASGLERQARRVAEILGDAAGPGQPPIRLMGRPS